MRKKLLLRQDNITILNHKTLGSGSQVFFLLCKLIDELIDDQEEQENNQSDEKDIEDQFSSFFCSFTVSSVCDE